MRAGQATSTACLSGFTRRRPGSKLFLEYLPSEREVVPLLTSSMCCGSEKLSKINEDATETLEMVTRRWKVIQTVRENFTCRV